MKGRIIGSGDIATFLKENKIRPDLTFFASGVSNSAETRQSEFRRELDLLALQPRDQHIVYFSTLSVFYLNNPYQNHKKAMEQVIKYGFPKYTIVRLGNITWGKNPNTLINYLKAHPEAEIRDEYRYICDEEELKHWLNLVPDWSVELNIPGKRMKVREIKEMYCEK